MIDTAELRIYLDELWRGLPRFAKHGAGLPAEERGSFEWLAAAGRFWWTAREDADFDRDHAARVLGCSLERLRLMEYGLVSPLAFGVRRLRAYSARLGHPHLYDTFRDHFER